MTKVVHAEMKRRGAIIQVRSTLRSKNRLDGSRERGQVLDTSKGRLDIREGEDRDVINRHDIGSHKLPMEEGPRERPTAERPISETKARLSREQDAKVMPMGDSEATKSGTVTVANSMNGRKETFKSVMSILKSSTSGLSW